MVLVSDPEGRYGGETGTGDAPHSAEGGRLLGKHETGVLLCATTCRAEVVDLWTIVLSVSSSTASTDEHAPANASSSASACHDLSFVPVSP